MHDQFLDSSHFPHNSPPRSAWGCALFALVVVLAIVAVSALCGGCINCYTRWPTTDEKIVRVYQCSREAAALSIVAAFPQVMTDAGHPEPFMWENIFTIPFLGLPCAMDAVCEACIDTACLPIDWPLAAARKENK